MQDFINKVIEKLKAQKSKINASDCKENKILTMQKNLIISNAIDIVNETADECRETTVSYKNDIITDFLQYLRDNANNYDYDTNEGWALSDLIILADEYCNKDTMSILAKCETEEELLREAQIRASANAKLITDDIINANITDGLMGVYHLGMKNMYHYLKEKKIKAED